MGENKKVLEINLKSTIKNSTLLLKIKWRKKRKWHQKSLQSFGKYGKKVK